MSDFEDRLRDALTGGAEDAPGTGGLAEGARRRLRARRRRVAVGGAVAAVVAVIVPVAVLGSDGDRPGTRETDQPPSALESQQVTCGFGSWPASAMEDGVPGLVDDAEVRAAFARLLEEAPMDAPEALRQEGADQAPYIALAETEVGYAIGTGTWTVEGPGKDAHIVGLEREGDGTLRAAGWGDCQLRVALPPGSSPVEVKAPRGGVDAMTTEPVVVVNELDCTSGRDPEPFLREPVIVEDDERVLVTMTSEPMKGGADCPGNPSVPVALNLDEPIGDRQLLDGGTWPPKPLKLANLEPWQTVEYKGVLVDVPGDWERLDTSSCEGDVVRFGPAGVDPCTWDHEGLAIFGSALFDSVTGPGLRIHEEIGWSGYVFTGDWVVDARAANLDEARRILASARMRGQEAPNLSADWRTESYGGLAADVPGSWRRGGLSAWCLDRSVPGWVEDPETVVKTIDCAPPRHWYGARFEDGANEGSPWAYAMEQTAGKEYPEGAWVGHLRPEGADGQVTVVAPTQALAELILGSVREE